MSILEDELKQEREDEQNELNRQDIEYGMNIITHAMARMFSKSILTAIMRPDIQESVINKFNSRSSDIERKANYGYTGNKVCDYDF